MSSPLVLGADSPSNIALIKYMGKANAELNLPANGSLSMTLKGLCTMAELERHPSGAGFRLEWVAEAPTRLKAPSGFCFEEAFSPSQKETERVLRHFDRVARAVREIFPRFGIGLVDGAAIKLRSANTFPHAAGIASSASSFSALTSVFAAALSADLPKFLRIWNEDVSFKRMLASVSREGSGSSCRSFEGPWVLWEKEQAAALQTGMPEMVNFVLLFATEPKQVSSSEAHALITTSPLWEKRPERVASRLSMLESALAEGNLSVVARIAWSELWEMHSLFHTCAEPFTYWEPATVEFLRWAAQQRKVSLSPIVTMDAGANVHLIVPKADQSHWQEELDRHFPDVKRLYDEQGSGTEILTDVTTR